MTAEQALRDEIRGRQEMDAQDMAAEMQPVEDDETQPE